MKKIRINSKTIIVLTILLLMSSFFFSRISIVKASNIKTLTITFNTTPTSATATKAPLKYNKDFAFSYSFDDGLSAGYDPAFKYMNGGYSDYIGQYFGGLYYTDGAGNNVPFRAGYAFYSRNTSYNDLHLTTPSYTKWTELQDAVDNGWDVFNHGYTSSTIPVNDPGKLYYSGDPGGHAIGTLDYGYELSQFNVDISSHINLKNNSGVVTGAFRTSQVILPNGDKNYIQPAFDGGFNAIYAQDNTYTFDGQTVVAPAFTDINNSISNNRHVMPRWFDNEYRYLSTGEYPGGLYNHVDQLAALSTGTDKYWSQEFTHQLTTSTYSPDWNGGMTWSSWKSLMDHVENTYGRFGNDKAWVAGSEEVYDYMMVKQNTIISQNLVGNQLTVTLDITNVPANLRHYALSLLVNSDATISSINYGSDFTSHTDNKTTGLINLDWGVNTYSKNDLTRVESLVSTAESSKRKSDIDVARSYNNLLVSATQKTAFNTRLDAIVVPLRTWFVNVKGVDSGCNSLTTKTFPSPNHPLYNWNYFYVGNSSLLCPDLTNLRDSDNQISTLALSNTAPFKNGSLSSASTGANSGIYPDTVISEKAQIYAASTSPAKVKIYGLESIKTYNIKLYGYTSATGQTGNSAITQYTIGGQTKELIVKGNTANTVEFLDILPVSGEIEITVAPKVAAWGYGFLNALEIKENLLAAPSALSYSSPHSYIKNNLITSLSPTLTGQGVTYSVSPSLPSGLSLDSSTGIISGTPSLTIGSTTYTVTATNTGGSISFGLLLSVHDLVPSVLSYSSPNVYTNGIAIMPLSPTVSGQGITYSVSPSLPSGLSLDPDSGQISGTPNGTTSLSVYTITATNTGGSLTFNLSLTVNNPAPINLSYSSPNIYSRGTIISSLLPTVTGTPTSYSVSPALPSGLSLDSSTGQITGTPTGIASLNTYIITATNTGGNTTFNLILTVNDIPLITPVVSPAVGIYNTNQSVTLSSTGSDYLRYGNSMPTDCFSGTLYAGSISVSFSQTIYVRACNVVGNSITANFNYVIDKIAPESPIAGIPTGTYNTTQSIPLSSVGSDYLRYSLLSSPSSCSSGTLYSGSISVSSSETIYVRACDLAGNSSLASFTYVIDTVAPEIITPSVMPSAYNSIQSVSLLSNGSDYLKYDFTSMPLSCSSGTLYQGPISITASLTLYVRACDIAGNSSTGNFNYIIDTTAPLTPMATPSSGTYNSNQEITLSASGSDSIFYDTSTMPADCSSGTLYSNPIVLNTSSTLYVRACDSVDNSSTASFNYVIDTLAPEIPNSSVSPGIYNTTQSISLNASGSSYLKYGTDIMPESCSSGNSYTGAISVSSSETLYVRACDDAGNSSTNTFAYVIDTVAPEIPLSSVAVGLYNTNQSISLSSTGSDYLKYGNSAPNDCASGTLYTGPLSISISQTIYVRACDNAGNYSVGSFAYIISVGSGEVITTTYMKYSTDSIPADCLAGTLYTEFLTLPFSQKIYIRVCNSLNDSSISTFEYVTPGKQNTSSGGGSSSFSSSISHLSSNPLTSNPADCTSQTLYSSTSGSKCQNTLSPVIVAEKTPVTTSNHSIQKVIKNLKFGMNDKDIKVLQMILIKQNKGPEAKALSLNGLTNYFGQLTKKALVEWQRANGLKADGLFGTQTRMKIKSLNL